MTCKQLAAVVALATALALPAADASASGPALLSSTPAANATGTARYAPSVTFTYDQPVTVGTPVSLVRTSTGAPVAASATVNGAQVTVASTATLLPGTRYTASVQPDGAAAPDTVSFTTLGAPAHPAIKVKIITALDDAATQDI